MLIGKPAPMFRFTTANGVTLSNESIAGQICILNFVAPTCGFCKQQMPKLEKLRPAYEAKGVRFVNVFETMGKKTFTSEEIASLLKALRIGADWAVDSGNTVGRAFRAYGFPTMVVLGTTGDVSIVHEGNALGIEERLRAQLDNLLARTTPAR